MIGEKIVLAVIPAKGHSRAVPRKNMRRVAGQSLVSWAISHAQESRFVDYVIVSTDDDEIAQEALNHLCVEVDWRPEELCSDEAKIEHVVQELLYRKPKCRSKSAGNVLSSDKKYIDIVVTLQPTCPMRKPREIDLCVGKCVLGYNSSSTISPHDEHPYKSLIKVDDKIVPYFGEEYLNAPRQSLPEMYKQTGGVYANDARAFLESGGSYFYVEPWAPVIVNEQQIDINTEQDILVADFLTRMNLYKHETKEKED